MAPAWNQDNAAHLLRRAGCAATPDAVKKLLKKPHAKAVASLFKRDKKKDTLPKKQGFSGLAEMQNWWLDRMFATSSPLVEKLTLFFHNHFATSWTKSWFDLMHVQNRTIRELCFGPFRDLVLGISRDPAMILWLDNNTNKQGSPNENYARELMELFTTGVLDKDGNANYTETDVAESARAFTGWTVSSGKYFFAPWNHDDGVKTFRGVTGNLDGTDVVENLVTDPATARRLCMKLFSFFCRDVALDDPLLDPLEAAYFDNDTEVRPVLETLFLSDAFYAPEARNARVKGPVEFFVGSLLLTGSTLGKDKWDDRADYVVTLGQSFFDPPSVFGWKEGLAWTGASGMLSRAEIAQDIAGARDKKGLFRFRPEKLLGKKKDYAAFTPEQTVDAILARLGPVEVSSATRDLLIGYVQDDVPPGGTFTLDAETIDKKVRGLVALVMSLPEFQVH